MVRFTAVLCFGSCLALQGWASGQVAQKATQQTAEIAQPADSQTGMGKPAGATGKDAVAAPSNWPLDQFKEFSALMVGSFLARDEQEAHIYRSGDLIRTTGPGPRTFIITNLENLDSRGLSPMGCVKISAPFYRAFPFYAWRPGRQVERVSAGKESMDGHVC